MAKYVCTVCVGKSCGDQRLRALAAGGEFILNDQNIRSNLIHVFRSDF